ncbi:MAG: hypothetical protein CV081_12775 [Nitrospira sp. LK265]|nr:hypothetical protein [Nitrospira sp. LK265]
MAPDEEIGWIPRWKSSGSHRGNQVDPILGNWVAPVRGNFAIKALRMKKTRTPIHFLPKPFDPDELVGLLDTLLLRQSKGGHA